jgi:hypothetical protein
LDAAGGPAETRLESSIYIKRGSKKFNPILYISYMVILSTICFKGRKEVYPRLCFFLFFFFFRYAEADENDDVTGTDGAEYATMEPEWAGGGQAPLGEVGEYSSLQGGVAQYASADALVQEREPYFHGVRTPTVTMAPLCQTGAPQS